VGEPLDEAAIGRLVVVLAASSVGGQASARPVPVQTH